MKKILVIIAIFVFPFLVFAKEIEVKDINIKLNVNDNYIVLMRNNLDNNSDLKKLGISEDYMKDTMEKNNIYADILAKDISYEILIVVPNVTLAFNDLKDATDAMMNSLKDELVKKTGAEVSSIYKGKHNYVVVDYYDKNTDYYIVNYYTIVNAKGYNIQLQKKTEIDTTEKEELKKVVDTINIDTVKSDNKTNSNKSSFNVKNIIMGAIIGAVVGLISYIIGIFIKKKNTLVKEDNTNKKKKHTVEDIEENNKKSSK